jgi:hypothetical protein
MRIVGRLSFALAGLLFAGPAYAGWTPGGVTIKSTTANIPLVKACSDGAGGSFVAWQEESSPGLGVLRIQHLLAPGDLDPAWPPDGAVACSVSISRADLGMVPDRLGGAYLWWREKVASYLTRIGADGHVAAGWPARGRAVSGGTLPVSGIEDGAHGIYLAMTSSGTTALAIHLGPSNSGAGGWPNGPRALVTTDDTAPLTIWPALALAPDGGIFAACASFGIDGTYTPGHWRFTRLTSAGTVAEGWPAEGIDFGVFDRALLGDQARAALLALTPDGRDGVYMMRGNPYDDGYATTHIETRIHRLQSDGSPAVDWPDTGKVVHSNGYDYYDGTSNEASYSLAVDEPGTVIAGLPGYYSESTTMYEHHCHTASSACGYASGLLAGHESAPIPAGGAWIASFYPTGPYGPYDPPAFLAVSLTDPAPGWHDFVESHSEILVHWYGDIGLAATDDGGGVFFWSQVNQRHGLFARRFTAAGEVTAVGEAHLTPPALDGARFVRGQGVRARVTLPAGATGHLVLLDVAGRRRTEQSLRGTGAAVDVALPGTGSLTAGIYFARLSWADRAAASRVVVLR